MILKKKSEGGIELKNRGSDRRIENRRPDPREDQDSEGATNRRIEDPTTFG